MATVVCSYCNQSNRSSAKFCYKCGSLLALSGLLQSNTILQNRYVIIKSIGKGGMASVYQALDKRIKDKIWAVKEMSEILLVNPDERKQAIDGFYREAELLAKLSHPNLPKVVDAFEENKRHYLVMEFIEGETLEEIVTNNAPQFLQENIVIGWIEQICDVLEYLHNQIPPIIFRDLKTENIMLTKAVDTLGSRDRIMLIDFGIARFFTPGKGKDTQVIGTPGYAPPEQHGKGQTDVRSDIYSLGVTMHRLLTLHDPATTPFNLPLPRSINSSISLNTENVIMKAISISPQMRFQSAKELKETLIGGDTFNNIYPIYSSPYFSIAPFTFSSGEQAKTLQELASICDHNRNEGAYHLYQENFDFWLRNVQHRHDIASNAKLIRHKRGDQQAGLEDFIYLLDPTLPKPKLHINTLVLDFGDIDYNSNQIAYFDISNVGKRGYLYGTITSQEKWINLSSGNFGCLVGNTFPVKLTIDTSKFNMKQTYIGEILVDSNVGKQTILVKVTLTSLPPKLLVSKKIIDFGTVMKGRSPWDELVILNTGDGLLDCDIKPKNSWIKVSPISFRNNSEIIDVYVDIRKMNSGTHTGEIHINSNGGDEIVKVQINIPPTKQDKVINYFKKKPVLPFIFGVIGESIPISILYSLAKANIVNGAIAFLIGLFTTPLFMNAFVTIALIYNRWIDDFLPAFKNGLLNSIRWFLISCVFAPIVLTIGTKLEFINILFFVILVFIIPVIGAIKGALE